MGKYDWGQAATGAASGAATGSIFGPIGTGVGALVGGAAGLFGSKKKKRKKISTLDPQQQALYDDYIKGLRGEGEFASLYNYDAEGANQNFDANVGRPAYRNFNENIIPGITGQFRQNNLQNSSYTGEALGRAGRDVQENLDALRSDMQFRGQQNAQQNKINGINNAFNIKTFDYQQPGKSSLDNILESVGPEAGKYVFDLIKSYQNKGTAAPTAPVM